MNGETGTSLAGYVHVINLAHMCIFKLIHDATTYLLAFEIPFEVACVYILVRRNCLLAIINSRFSSFFLQNEIILAVCAGVRLVELMLWHVKCLPDHAPSNCIEIIFLDYIWRRM